MFLGLALAATSISRAALEWRGMIERGNGPTFALVDTDSGTTRWVPIRGTFLGYTVESYDAQRQLLVLSREGARTELTLTSGRTPSTARSAPDELRSLSGLPLAEALAKRGDQQMKDLLARHRGAVLKMEELSRLLAEAERREHDAGDDAADKAPVRPAAKPAPQTGAAAAERKAFEEAEQQAAALAAEIERVAQQKRDALLR